MSRELWDAYDREGSLLGFDLVRGEAIPKGAYHQVAEVYAVTHGGCFLVTQRHPDKTWGLHWEVTGGAVLKGETAAQGAVRELREETGIAVQEAELHPVYAFADDCGNSYHCFLAFFDPRQQAIRLQEGETVDWRLLPYGEFLDFIRTEAFTDPIRNRFLAHQGAFEALLQNYLRE